MMKRVLALMAVLFLIMSADVTKAEAAYKQNGVDIMIICAHPGDEFLFLGGALPQYVGEQMRSAVVVYLSSEDEAQREQAKASLAVYGDRVHAIFGSFSYIYTSTKEEAQIYWDMQELTGYIVSAIREYKPTIVLTHDKLGEYGHGAHCITFDATYQAVPFAADASRYPESKAAFGTWDVQRFFSHLYGENLVSLDRSNPLKNVGGMTALELDQQCYQTYEKTYPIKITDGAGYTCAKYGLVFPEIDTTLDVTSGDLFDGLDASTLYPTAAPSATPSPTPEATAQAEPLAAMTQTPRIAQETNAAATSPRLSTSQSCMIVLGALALACFGLAVFLK